MTQKITPEENRTPKWHPDPADKSFGWLNTYHELATRPALVAELKVNRILRGHLFYAFNVLFTCLQIKDTNVGMHVLTIMSDYEWKKLYDRFGKELEARPYPKAVHNELVGVWHNLVLNLKHALRPDRVHLPQRDPHFVFRAVHPKDDTDAEEIMVLSIGEFSEVEQEKREYAETHLATHLRAAGHLSEFEIAKGISYEEARDYLKAEGLWDSIKESDGFSIVDYAAHLKKVLVESEE